MDGPHPFTGHQKLGVVFQPDDCSFPLETSSDCLTGIGAAKEPTASVNYRGADSFVVYTWLDCGLVGMGQGANAVEELKQRTRRAHENNVQTVVENVFWTGGSFATSQYLAADTPISETVGGSIVNLQTAANIITGTYDITKAISLLEGAMATCYGGVPLIHVPREVTPFLANAHLIKEAGSLIKTTGNNSIIVPGPGYPGTGPDGEAPDANTTWIYATGSVKMWRSEPFFTAHNAGELLLRDVNDTVEILEQRFMFGWDCCHFAIQVALPNTTIEP